MSNKNTVRNRDNKMEKPPVRVDSEGRRIWDDDFNKPVIEMNTDNVDGISIGGKRVLTEDDIPDLDAGKITKSVHLNEEMLVSGDTIYKDGDKINGAYEKHFNAAGATIGISTNGDLNITGSTGGGYSPNDEEEDDFQSMLVDDKIPFDRFGEYQLYRKMVDKRKYIHNGKARDEGDLYYNTGYLSALVECWEKVVDGASDGIIKANGTPLFGAIGFHAEDRQAEIEQEIENFGKHGKKQGFLDYKTRCGEKDAFKWAADILGRKFRLKMTDSAYDHHVKSDFSLSKWLYDVDGCPEDVFAVFGPNVNKKTYTVLDGYWNGGPQSGYTFHIDAETGLSVHMCNEKFRNGDTQEDLYRIAWTSLRAEDNRTTNKLTMFEVIQRINRLQFQKDSNNQFQIKPVEHVWDYNGTIDEAKLAEMIYG